jgi:hypothetical protein
MMGAIDVAIMAVHEGRNSFATENTKLSHGVQATNCVIAEAITLTLPTPYSLECGATIGRVATVSLQSNHSSLSGFLCSVHWALNERLYFSTIITICQYFIRKFSTTPANNITICLSKE